MTSYDVGINSSECVKWVKQAIFSDQFRLPSHFTSQQVLEWFLQSAVDEFSLLTEFWSEKNFILLLQKPIQFKTKDPESKVLDPMTYQGPRTWDPGTPKAKLYHFFETRLQITAITITTILPICQFVRKKGCTTLLWWDSKIKRTCWLQPRWLTHYNSFITFWIIHFKIVTRIANDQFSVLHHGAILHHPMLILILGTLDHVSTVKVTTKTQIFTDQKSSSNTAVYSYVLDEIFPFVLDYFFSLLNAQVYFDFFF